MRTRHNMVQHLRGRLATIALLLLCLTSINVNATDVYFNVVNVFGTPQPISTNRTFRIQSLSPFAGQFFYRTSSVAGEFWVSNALPTTYAGTLLAPPSSVTFSFLVTATNLGTVDAQGITSIPANGVQTFPAGQTAWSAQASDLRYAPSGTGPNGSLTAAQSTNLTASALPTNFWFSSPGAWLTNIIGLGSINTNRYAPGTFLTAATNGQTITFNAANQTNGFTPIVFSNSASFATTNLMFVTSNALAGQIGSAGASLVQVTNVATNQVFLGTNGFSSLVYTNSSQVLMTNRLPALTNGFVTSSITNGLASVTYAQSLTNGYVRSDITNGFVRSDITNGLASVLLLNTVSNKVQLGKVDITNGIARNLSSFSQTNYADLTFPNGGSSTIINSNSIGVQNLNVDVFSGNGGEIMLQSQFQIATAQGEIDDGNGHILIDSSGLFTGNANGLTNLTVAGISTNGSVANQVVTSVGGRSVWTNVVAIIPSAITNVYGTNLFTVLVANQAAFIPTNFDIKGGSNFLYQTKLDETNGTSYGQVATNFATEGNVSFGATGQATNIIAGGTNLVKFINAGSQVATNGVFIWNPTLGCYTNWITGCIYSNSGSAYLLISNTVTLYSLAGTSPFGATATGSGALPAPLAVPTFYLDHNGMQDVGYFSVTNINFISNSIVVTGTNNAIASTNGFGTSTFLTNSTLTWVTGTMNFQAMVAGQNNAVTGSGFGAAVLSGATNSISLNGGSVIAGGVRNSIGSGSQNGCGILGGTSNNMTGQDGTSIIGGLGNSVPTGGGYGLIGGGIWNKIDTVAYGVILGGRYNTNSGSKNGGVILGGESNIVIGNFSMAAGRSAKATNDSVFVWSDGSPANSTTNGQFVIASTNGLFVEIGGITLTNLNPGTATMALGVTATGTLTTNGVPGGGGGGSGTVTSVAQTMPGEFTVTGSPVTTSGTLAVTRTADANFLGLGMTNASFVKITNTASIGGQAWISSLIVTNGFTNLALTASSLVKSDANKKVSSVANWTGVLTNDGAGNLGGMSFLDATTLVTNQYVITGVTTNLLSTQNGILWTNLVPVPASGRTNVVLEKSDGSMTTNDLAGLLVAAGGASQTPWLSDINGAGRALYNVADIMLTNSGAFVGMLGHLTSDSVYGEVLTLTGTTNNVAGPSTISLSNIISGSIFSAAITATGGSISVIPTNAAPTTLILSASGISLPVGITNTFAGRAEPIIRYYMVDAVAGTPCMTLSNEMTGVKLVIGAGALTGLTTTNFATLPITTTNQIWRIRDESGGSGASVGILTNWLNGL